MKPALRKRLLFGPVLVAVLAGIYWLDAEVLGRPIASRLLLWTMAVVALHEALAIGRRRVESHPGLFFYAAVAVIAVVVPHLVTGEPVPGALLALAALIGGGIRLLGMAPLRSAPAVFPEAVLLAGSILYVAGLLVFLDRILAHSVATAFAVVAVSKTSDILGFLVGSQLGRKAITPAVSPKKTWEGTIAGALGSAGVAALLTPQLAGPPWFAALIGLTIGVASFFGDLLASALKRWGGVKDSGSLVPEFGGVIDMLDGVLVASPIAALWLYGN